MAQQAQPEQRDPLAQLGPASPEQLDRVAHLDQLARKAVLVRLAQAVRKVTGAVFGQARVKLLRRQIRGTR